MIKITISIIVSVISIFFLSTFATENVTVQANTQSPPGCGNTMGPPSPGTICPDGTIPLKDGRLPLGCPGSSQQGPMGSNYEAVCPARPGRPECTFSMQQSTCITAGGEDVMRGTNQTPSAAGGTSTGSAEINGYLATGVNILTAVAGLAIVGSIIFGGIQYTTAGGNASQVSAAKTRITVSVASIILLAFGYALLQWLIPGGVFK